jgi:glutamate synthase (NADPH) small chain
LVSDPRAFLKYPRQNPAKRPVEERVGDYAEVEQPMPAHQLEQQAARCMDCGIPFCHIYGCPLGNLVPEWNEMVVRGHWRQALDLLHATNNLPEVTGRVCPAPCEAACTLEIHQPAVSIKHIELQIVERGWANGWVQPQPARTPSGRKVAVIGSGPAGLVAAQQLARAGHQVVVFERADRPGGILRYGIPDFKLEKHVIDRRLGQMQAEGVTFETGVEAGVDISVRYMQRSFDAVMIAAGARVPRSLDIPGNDLQGIHFAMPYLTQQNRINAGRQVPDAERISARDKRVVVLGGGDTGADCVGTARRQGARSIHQIELLPKPPDGRSPDNAWPTWPQVLRTSSSHEEGCERLWSVGTREFIGQGNRVAGLRCERLEWTPVPGGRPECKALPGSGFCLDADLVLLALGFLRVEHGALTEGYGLDADARGNLIVDENHMTSRPGVFAGGDAVLGASLVVRAIHLGRQTAASIDRYLRS